jgi:hypothetical protein
VMHKDVINSMTNAGISTKHLNIIILVYIFMSTAPINVYHDTVILVHCQGYFAVRVYDDDKQHIRVSEH